MKTINLKKLETNPILNETVEPDTDLKNMLVEYVGTTLSPENREVTVEMVIDVMANEFPEFVLSLAEENWVRGYQQALTDVEVGKNLAEKETKNEQKKSCKLCQKTE